MLPVAVPGFLPYKSAVSQESDVEHAWHRSDNESEENRRARRIP